MSDEYSADQLVEEVLAYFQRKLPQHPKKQKRTRNFPQEPVDYPLPEELILELKTLRERQKLSIQKSYVGIASASKRKVN
jgi:hypothetical protein